MNTTQLFELTQEIHSPMEGMQNRVLYQDEQIKAVGFGFAAGHNLIEHSTTKNIMLTFVSGEATVSLGDEKKQVRPGTWIHIPADVKHSIHAITPVVMLLVMLK